MISPITPLTQILQTHHLSLTTPRRVIYEQLASNEPLTMAQLVAACPGIDRASAYRTTRLFERLGIVQKLQIGWKYKLELTNTYQDHHHHFTCRQCGLIQPLPEDTALERRLKELVAGLGLTAEDHQLEIRGLCADCQKTTKT